MNVHKIHFKYEMHFNKLKFNSIEIDELSICDE